MFFYVLFCLMDRDMGTGSGSMQEAGYSLTGKTVGDFSTLFKGFIHWLQPCQLARKLFTTYWMFHRKTTGIRVCKSNPPGRRGPRSCHRQRK